MLSGGPISTGTRAEYSKFHDDQSTYTGAYAVLHHVPDDLRASKVRFQKPHWKQGRARPSDADVPGLRQQYQSYTSFAAGNGVDMNIKVWAKLVNETGLIGRKFNMTSADIIFAKVAEGNKLLQYRDFFVDAGALRGGARRELPRGGGARRSARAGELGHAGGGCARHDDKSTFTGAHAALRVAATNHRPQGLEARAPAARLRGRRRERLRRVLRRARRRRGRKQARCHGRERVGAPLPRRRFVWVPGIYQGDGAARCSRASPTRAPPSSGTWTSRALDLGAEKVSVTYGDLCLTLLELGLGDEDATRQRGDDDAAAAEARWRAVEAENREREMAAEMDRQKRWRRRGGGGLRARAAPRPPSPPTPTRARGTLFQSASPRLENVPVHSSADAADEDGPAMKELKDYVANETNEGASHLA